MDEWGPSHVCICSNWSVIRTASNSGEGVH